MFPHQSQNTSHVAPCVHDLVDNMLKILLVKHLQLLTWESSLTSILLWSRFIVEVNSSQVTYVHCCCKCKGKIQRLWLGWIQKWWRLTLTVSLPPDNMDRTVSVPSRASDRCHSGSGVRSQLPAAQPHRRSDGWHVAHHEGRRGDVLRSAGCAEGEAHRVFMCAKKNKKTCDL